MTSSDAGKYPHLTKWLDRGEICDLGCEPAGYVVYLVFGEDKPTVVGATVEDALAKAEAYLEDRENERRFNLRFGTAAQ